MILVLEENLTKEVAVSLKVPCSKISCRQLQASGVHFVPTDHFLDFAVSCRTEIYAGDNGVQHILIELVILPGNCDAAKIVRVTLLYDIVFLTLWKIVNRDRQSSTTFRICNSHSDVPCHKRIKP